MWECWFFLSMSRSKGLEAAKITLWASICWLPSLARVTSQKSSVRSFNDPAILFWKSSHLRQNFSEFIAQWSEIITDFFIYLHLSSLALLDEWGIQNILFCLYVEYRYMKEEDKKKEKVFLPNFTLTHNMTQWHYLLVWALYNCFICFSIYTWKN